MSASRFGPGVVLVALGCLLFATTVVAGAAFGDPSGGTPDVTAPSDAPTDNGTRQTVLGVQGNGSYHAGGYVAMLDGREMAWRESSSDVYFDVTRLDNGSVLAGFMSSGYDDCGPYESPCHRTGFRVVEPSPDPQVVYEWSFPVRNRVASEVHDVEPLPDGGFVVADMEHERIAVVEGGEVTWEWYASTRYDAPPDPTREDWLHINDVDRIGDGRYLVSVRNANQLLVLQRGEGVVEVINADHDDATDDDGLVGDPSVLNHQHNPQWLGDGAVLVADSENHRIVELHRTESGEWRPAWTLTEAAGTKLDWPRDADRLPGGTTLVTDTRNARLVEVNESGDVVWDYQMDYRTLPYEADRLPPGEAVGGETYGSPPAGADEESVPPTGDETPVLTPLFRLVSAGVRLPLWFGELHLLSTLVSLGLVVTGGVVAWRARRA